MPPTDLACLLYVVVVVAVLAARAWLQKRAWIPSSVWATLIVVITSAFIIVFRWRVVTYDVPINPDEALMSANSMLVRYGWLNWNIVDPLTSGPLNSLILAWPYLIGGDVTLSSTRLTGVVCLVGTLAILFLVLKRVFGEEVGAAAVVPAALFLVATTAGDFLHYSSELLPDLLIAVAIFLLVVPRRRRTGVDRKSVV